MSKRVATISWEGSDHAVEEPTLLSLVDCSRMSSFCSLLVDGHDWRIGRAMHECVRVGGGSRVVKLVAACESRDSAKNAKIELSRRGGKAYSFVRTLDWRDWVALRGNKGFFADSSFTSSRKLAVVL